MVVGVNYEAKRCLKILGMPHGLSESDNTFIEMYVNLDRVVFARYMFFPPSRIEIQISDGSIITGRPGFSRIVTPPGLSNYHSFLMPNENQFEREDSDVTDESPGISGGTAPNYDTMRCIITQEITEDVNGAWLMTAINLDHVLWSEQRQNDNLNGGFPFMEVHMSTGKTLRVKRSSDSNDSYGWHSFKIYNLNTFIPADSDPEDATP